MSFIPMDRDPRAQGLYNPVAQQGPIVGKAFPDAELIEQFKANASDPGVAKQVYPNGNMSRVHDIMPNHFVFGYREMYTSEFGDAEERGIQGVAGLNYATFGSHRAMEDAFYFLGVATTPQRDSSDQDPQHGFATLRAGTISVPNNGPQVIYAGQHVTYRFPLTKKSGGLTSEQMDRVLRGTTAGDVPTQYMPEIIPFDPTDYNIQIAAGYANMFMSQNQAGQTGSADVPFEQAFNANAEDKLDSLQELGMAMKYGDLGKVLRGIEVLVRHGVLEVTGNIKLDEQLDAADFARGRDAAAGLASTMDLFETKPQGTGKVVQQNILGAIYMRALYQGNARRLLEEKKITDDMGMSFEEIMTNPSKTTEVRMAKLAALIPDMSFAAITNAWYSKTSKIVGKATKSSAPGDTLDLMLGHFVL